MSKGTLKVRRAEGANSCKTNFLSNYCETLISLRSNDQHLQHCGIHRNKIGGGLKQLKTIVPLNFIKMAMFFGKVNLIFGKAFKSSGTNRVHTGQRTGSLNAARSCRGLVRRYERTCIENRHNTKKSIECAILIKVMQLQQSNLSSFRHSIVHERASNSLTLSWGPQTSTTEVQQIAPYGRTRRARVWEHLERLS